MVNPGTHMDYCQRVQHIGASANPARLVLDQTRSSVITVKVLERPRVNWNGLFSKTPGNCSYQESLLPTRVVAYPSPTSHALRANAIAIPFAHFHLHLPNENPRRLYSNPLDKVAP